MENTQRPRPDWMHFNKLIPNILTILALCAGMTGIRLALLDRWEHAVLALLVAAILDALDGRIARILKGSSKFGAELDSLSDFICFGVAPALILYLWTMQSFGRFGWMLALLFSICSALRLARFNTALDDEDKPAWTRNFFTGSPAPASAGLVCLPMILYFQTEIGFFREPFLVALFMISVAALMVSPVPTYSFKRIKVAHNWFLPSMIIAAVVVVALVSAPWTTLSVVLITYICTIPFSIRAYQRHETEQGSGKVDIDADDGTIVSGVFKQNDDDK
ncbi:MAG: CDP-diacylglycerol--serine O-phosphatidyltransferase [Rhodospirillales bacterium]|nr:CDP-diacylglycerol--serine O-phosphatidyltransferase [Rhodospirillales bacterium]